MRCFASTPSAAGSSNHERSGAPDWGSAELANQLQLSTWYSALTPTLLSQGRFPLAFSLSSRVFPYRPCFGVAFRYWEHFSEPSTRCTHLYSPLSTLYILSLRGVVTAAGQRWGVLLTFEKLVILILLIASRCFLSPRPLEPWLSCWVSTTKNFVRPDRHHHDLGQTNSHRPRLHSGPQS